jgi:hypothetical protein
MQSHLLRQAKALTAQDVENGALKNDEIRKRKPEFM